MKPGNLVLLEGNICIILDFKTFEHVKNAKMCSVLVLKSQFFKKNEKIIYWTDEIAFKKAKVLT